MGSAGGRKRLCLLPFVGDGPSLCWKRAIPETWRRFSAQLGRGTAGARQRLVPYAPRISLCLISSPADELADDRTHEARQGIPESDIEQNSQGTAPTQAGGQHHSELVHHSSDTDALLGLCHHLLLDAMSCLWPYSESFPSKPTVPRKSHTR